MEAPRRRDATPVSKTPDVDFSLVTGEPSSLPATKPEPVYAVRIDDGDVYVEVP